MIPISAGLFNFDKDRLNYVYGGTYSHYMPLMAQYKMQMDMINIAKKNKLPIYDFGGISGNFDEKSPNYGVYAFKKGYGGKVVEYIGEFDLVINKPIYTIYNEVYSKYREIKKIKSKVENIENMTIKNIFQKNNKQDID